MRWCLLGLFAMGCEKSVTGTVVDVSNPRDCPTDRPIEVTDLDCMCGAVQTFTLVDTVVPDDCDELWCHADELELECVVYESDSGG